MSTIHARTAEIRARSLLYMLVLLYMHVYMHVLLK